MTKKPNILYMHSHDTGRFIQPYGHSVKTPHLQRLAEQGILFRQAFCAAPTCSPSRACLLTGQSAHSNGMTGLAHRGFSLNNYSHHIVHTLKSAGYYTALSGVQHIATGDNFWKTIGYDAYLGGQESAEKQACEFIDNSPSEKTVFPVSGVSGNPSAFHQKSGPGKSRLLLAPFAFTGYAGNPGRHHSI